MAITNQYNSGTDATIGKNNRTDFYDRAGIEAANRKDVYGQFASRKNMPTMSGKTYKISKFLHLYDRELGDAEFASKGYMTARSLDEVTASLNSAVLSEGAGAVNKRQIKKVTFETSMAHYGEMIDYTDDVVLFSEDEVQLRYHRELGELANSRMEDLIQLDMLSTGTVMYGGSATSLGTVDGDSTVSYDLIRGAVRKLTRNRAQKNTTLVKGSKNVDTQTVASTYFAIIGPEVKNDLERQTRGNGAEKEFVFVPVHKYASAANIATGEVGAMHEVRFIESESAVVERGKGADASTNPKNLSATNGNFDVFPILFPSQDAFATVGLKGKGKINFHSSSPDKIEKTNPYGTQGFFSYDFRYAGIILEEEKLLKVLVSASA